MNVLSLTVHESELCVADQCLNYLALGGADRIVIHVNRTSAFDAALLERLTHEIDLLRGKVVVNPLSLAITPMRDHPALSQSVHMAHVQNFLFASQVFDIGHFMLDASNSLLIRAGLGSRLEGPYRLNFGDMARWHWRGAYESDVAIERRHRRISSHEGSCYRADVFEKMLPFLLRYELQSQKTGFDYVVQYPREEALFTNALLDAGWEPEPRATYIDMPWHRNLAWDLATVAETLANDSLAPAKFGIKRVARRIDDPVRAAIGAHFGYRSQLAAAASRVNAA